MVLNVKVNGLWREVGKDISWEDYQEYQKALQEKHIEKVSSDLKVGEYNFDVLDFERRADFECLILRFPTITSLDGFVEDSELDVDCQVLEDTLVKVVVW